MVVRGHSQSPGPLGSPSAVDGMVSGYSLGWLIHTASVSASEDIVCWSLMLCVCSMPNFSLAPAMDVLCTGSYPRLPSCIHDNIIPPSPLSGSEAESALDELTVAVRRRLLTEDIPAQMTVISLGM